MQVAWTDRLVIRPFELEDSPFILRLLNEPSFIENIADKGVRTLDQAAAYLTAGPLASYRAHGHGHGLCLVELRDSGEAIGMCGLLKREEFTEVDLGYAFLPEFCGQGYAFEAATAVLAFGRQTLGLDKVIAIVSPGNDRSTGLLARLGFVPAGLVPMAGHEAPVALYEWGSPV